MTAYFKMIKVLEAFMIRINFSIYDKVDLPPTLLI